MSEDTYYSRRERKYDSNNNIVEYNDNKKFKQLFIAFLILSILLGGHLVWCLAKHVYSPETKICTVCELPEDECTCAEDLQDMSVQIAELEARIAELGGDADENGCLHCPIHCPDGCEHIDTYIEEGEWKWSIVGRKEVCRVGVRVINTVCSDCGAVVDTEKQTEVDSEHDFSDGDTCKKCGYKDSESGKITPKPTSKPSRTSKPSQTRKPQRTSRPDATKKPTECSHSKTKREASVKWVAIGTEDTCGKNVTTITVVCSKCGKELSSETSTEVVHKHEFDGRTCVNCGYKRPLKEGYGKAEGTIPPSYEKWEYDYDGEIPDPVDE